MNTKRTSRKQSKQSNSWIEALEAIIVNDDQWSCMIAMIVESTFEHSEYVRLFEEASEEGSRRAIYSLTSRKLINSVKMLARYDEEKCPVAQGVCHHANRLLIRGEKLEAWLIAKLVKFLIHRARMEMIAKPKRDSDFENDMDRMMTLNSKNVKSQSSVKSGKSKESNAEVTSKVNTRLRKRGEEPKDKVYMDDAPEDGPKLYVILSGFYDSNLPVELIKAGFPAVCLLKIKRSKRTFDFVEDPENNGENHPEKREVIGPVEDKSFDNSMGKVLSEFWSTLERSANDPESLEAYSSVIFRNFCPPELPSSDDKIDEFKKDLYDRVSLIVYDLYDLQRLHSQYIKSMKIQHVPVELKKESKIYPRIMNEIPAECSFVSVIVQAMLAEVQAEFQDNEENQKIASSKKDFLHSDRIMMDTDELRIKTYHVSLGDETMNLVNPKPNSLSELALRSLWDPRIINLWNEVNVSQEILENRRNYINNLARHFKPAKNRKQVSHYLNLRFFSKMIHGHLEGSKKKDRRDEIRGEEYISLVSRSDPLPLSFKAIQGDRTPNGNPISNLSSRWSDSIIDYHVSQTEILECSGVSARKNRRETLGEPDASGIESSEKLGETRDDSSSYLEDFIDVLPLSSSALLQAIHQCSSKYQTFHSHYCVTTDSMLVCFAVVDSSQKFPNSEENIEKNDNSSPQTLKIITPVCLRNFCEYVVHEARDFIRGVELSRAAKRSISVAELTRKLSHHGDSGIPELRSFTEDDFILPNSLKGQMRRRDEEKLMEVADAMKNTDEQTAKSQNDEQSRRKRISDKKISKEKAEIAEKEDDGLAEKSTMSSERIKDADAHKILGFDLGHIRIELTYCTEVFQSPDEFSVKVDTDQWLYGGKRLRIGIDVPGCFLKLERIVEKNENLPFHLITESGIVVAFEKNKIQTEDSLNGKANRSGFPFEFRVSWPSSLLVELMRGCDKPFCVMQRYISKGPECGNVSRESYRKFLRNGTVLKFLDDNEVEVLRPNGTIVRCLEYSKFPHQFAPGQHDNLAKESWTKHSKRRTKLSPRRKHERNSEDEHLQKSSFLSSSFDRNSGEKPAEVKITRYTVVEHDGRRYEVEDDEVSRVYDRSLMRTSTDVEACEKFTRRDDGTRSVLNFNCELFVCFPDGTRIITGCIIEDLPVYCDWSDEEFIRFFAKEISKLDENEEVGSDENQSGSDNVSAREDDRLRILLSEGFVSVLMTCRMEHECYASVAYEPIEKRCRLSMPDELEICAHDSGTFDVKLGRNVEFLVREEELRFSLNICQGRESVSIYNLRETKSENEYECSESLLVTTDSFGNVFEVKGDGSVSRSSPRNILKKRHRLFAVNRDFTGCEYLHKSDQEERSKKIHSRGGCFPVLTINGFPEYQLFLSLLTPANYSKKWLQKVTRIRKTLRNETALPPSTYAIPYDWLFPFGKRSCDEANAALTTGDEKVLTLTITERIANDGDRFLCELEQAIRCWQKKEMNLVDEDHFFPDESSSGSPTEEIEKILSDLAVGIETSIDTLQYLRDLSIQGKDHKSEGIPGPRSKRETQREALKKETILWYKRCIRERIILPYFKNIQGSCFLWIMDCVDRALQLAE